MILDATPSMIFSIFDVEAATTGPGSIWKDADRNSASDGGQDTSIALIWTVLVKNSRLWMDL